MNAPLSPTPVATHFTPLFSPFDLDRLDVSALNLGPSREPQNPEGMADWQEVHRLVQWIFNRMATRIGARWPMIRSRGGKTSARSYFLYTYMTFGLCDEESLEFVIVGLLFEPTPPGDGVRVSGDIGGEESGRIDFELEGKSVMLSRTEVIPLALEMATRLAEQTDLIAKAVLERHPAPEY
jgi:hypothetical protein